MSTNQIPLIAPLRKWVARTRRTMSAVRERAVGQRPDRGRQRTGVFEGHVVAVEVHEGVTDDDRAAVSGAEEFGEVGVLPAGGLGCGGLRGDADFVDRRRP